jgi:hypothetical protein
MADEAKNLDYLIVEYLRTKIFQIRSIKTLNS